MNIKTIVSKIIPLLIFLSILSFTVNCTQSSNSLTYFNVQVGQNPYKIAIANGLVYVVNEGSNNVSVINGTKVIANIPVGSLPVSVAYNPYNGYVYVVNLESFTVSVINGTKVIANVEVGQYPGEILYNPINHYIYVADQGSNDVVVINGTKVIARVPVPSGPSYLAYNPKNGLVYVSNGGLFTVSVINNTKVVANITVGNYPNFIYYDEYNGLLYVVNLGSNSISVIQGLNVVNTLKFNTTPFRISASPQYLYVTLPLENKIYVFDQSSGQLVTTLNISSPGAIVYNPYTNYTYVTSSSSAGDQLVIINGTNVVGAIPIGKGIHEIAYYMGTIYVSNSASNTVTIIATTIPVPKFNLTFIANGIPASETWYVYIQGANFTKNVSVTGQSITFTLPEGQYIYKVYASHYVASPSEGVINLTSSQTISITFKPRIYTLTILETGLPTGTMWGVTINATTYTNSSNQLVIKLPYGLYSLQIINVSEYKANVTSLVIKLDKDMTIYVKYTQITTTTTTSTTTTTASTTSTSTTSSITSTTSTTITSSATSTTSSLPLAAIIIAIAVIVIAIIAFLLLRRR